MIPQLLTPEQSLQEAIHILQNGYQSSTVKGYDAALLDATNPAHDGIPLVLQRMTESIKSMEKQKYIQGIITTHIHQTDWRTRCQMARFLLKKDEQYLPARLRQCNPTQLVDNCSALIMLHLQIRNLLRQIDHQNFLSI